MSHRLCKPRLEAACWGANPALLLVCALFLAALLCLWSGVSQAAGAAGTEANQSCLSCHQKEGMDDGGAKDLGPHQGLACLDCHRGAQHYPHDDLKLAPCQSCHTPTPRPPPAICTPGLPARPVTGPARARPLTA